MNRLTSRTGAGLLLHGLIISTVLLARAEAQQPSPAVGDPAAAARTGSETKLRGVERYPNRLQARLELRQRTLSTVSSPGNWLSPRFIVSLTKRWQPGQTLKVAFRGGDKALHRDIATAVTEWSKYANLNFDFGVDPAGNYRAWSTSDTNFVAEIRVGFDQVGYYSLVGNDSINRTVSRPAEESLNLQGFDQARPDDWKAVVLHEFGHSIAFEHEHQSPLAPCDFRFSDDPGYMPTTDAFGQYIPDSRQRKPGLYTVLGGPPNNWPAAVVDFNLKQLTADSNAYEVGPFDKDSIMKYFFPDWMFVAGMKSSCYNGEENLVLSDGDKQGAGKLYPRAPESIRSVVAQRAQALEGAAKVESLPSAAIQHFQEELTKIQNK